MAGFLECLRSLFLLEFWDRGNREHRGHRGQGDLRQVLAASGTWREHGPAWVVGEDQVPWDPDVGQDADQGADQDGPVAAGPDEEVVAGPDEEVVALERGTDPARYALAGVPDGEMLGGKGYPAGYSNGLRRIPG